MESNKIIYLEDLKYKDNNGNSRNFPAGIKYNCRTCKSEMFTHPYGSYKYCYSCFTKWNKSQANDTNDEFIDD